LVCISGNAVYQDEKGASIELRAGDYLDLEANVKHWVDATEESNFIVIK
jgi:quercetin dioxygenase-like cupin family protein